MKANRKYKDSIFTQYFSDKQRLVELYNAVCGTDYPPETDVKINTLENALYMDQINDISFLLDGQLVVLIEHQSTVNENMPLRALLYIGRIYEKVLQMREIYREQTIPVPSPVFIVLYNGDRPYPDKKVLKLSDAFSGNANAGEVNLEVLVTVYNVNKGHNEEILNKSRALLEYVTFIDRVKGNRAKGSSLEDSIEEAIRYCIERGILVQYLTAHGSEVRNMLFTEFNMEDAKEVWFEEGKAEGMRVGEQKGRKEGKCEGREEGIVAGRAEALEKAAVEMMKKGLDDALIVEVLDITEEVLVGIKAKC